MYYIDPKQGIEELSGGWLICIFRLNSCIIFIMMMHINPLNVLGLVEFIKRILTTSNMISNSIKDEESTEGILK